MITLSSVVLLGFALGLRHALDADHVAAVSTIVGRESTVRRAAGVGALWGLGHSLTLLAAGGALVMFRLALPPRFSVAMELMAAVMLIVLGAVNLGRTERRERATIQPVLVGMIHGFAASAALTLLIVPAIRDGMLAIVYLAVFGLGTVAGMAIMTCALAAPIAYARRFGAQRALSTGFSVASIGFGLILAYQTVM